MKRGNIGRKGLMEKINPAKDVRCRQPSQLRGWALFRYVLCVPRSDSVALCPCLLHAHILWVYMYRCTRVNPVWRGGGYTDPYSFIRRCTKCSNASYVPTVHAGSGSVAVLVFTPVCGITRYGASDCSLRFLSRMSRPISKGTQAGTCHVMARWPPLERDGVPTKCFRPTPPGQDSPIWSD